MSARNVMVRFVCLALCGALPLAAHAQISGTPKASTTAPGVSTLGAAGGAVPYNGLGLVPYPATGGSTSRTAGDRAADTLSARDINVKCDVNRLSSVTGTDDTAALTSALSALALATGNGSGMPRLIIHGACLTGPLTITRPIHLMGDGQSSSSLVLKSGSTAPLLTVAVAYDATNYYTSGNPPADVTISDLEMTSQSNADGPGQGVAHGLALRAAGTNPIYTSVHVDHVKIHNMPGNGIDGAGFGANGFLDADHIYLKANAGYNMNITADYDWRIDHADINGAGLDNILWSGSAGIVVDNSTIYSAGNNNINYYQASGSTADGQNIISNSAIDGAQWAGIRINQQGSNVTLSIHHSAVNHNSNASVNGYSDIVFAGDATHTILDRVAFDNTNSSNSTLTGGVANFPSHYNIEFASGSTGGVTANLPAILATAAQAYSDTTRVYSTVISTDPRLPTGAASGPSGSPVLDVSAVSGGAWTAFTPTLSCGSGTVTTGSATARYRKLDKSVSIYVQATINTNGTCASTVKVTLPFANNTFFPSVFNGRENNVTGALVIGIVPASSNTLAILTGSNTYPGGTGYVLILEGVYESQ